MRTTNMGIGMKCLLGRDRADTVTRAIDRIRAITAGITAIEFRSSRADSRIMPLLREHALCFALIRDKEQTSAWG